MAFRPYSSARAWQPPTTLKRRVNGTSATDLVILLALKIEIRGVHMLNLKVFGISRQVCCFSHFYVLFAKQAATHTAWFFRTDVGEIDELNVIHNVLQKTYKVKLS
jgi:hypothetical protein